MVASTQLFLSYLLQAIIFFQVEAASFDKTPWKPVFNRTRENNARQYLPYTSIQPSNKTRENARQYRPYTVSQPSNKTRENARQYRPYTNSQPSNSQAYSGPQQSMVARPVTYVPPAVTFNPPRLVYSSPSVTRAVSSSPASSHYRQSYSVYPQQSQPGYMDSVQSATYSLPSYAAPAQPQQYQLVNNVTPGQVTPAAMPMPPHTVTYHFTPQQQAITTSAPSQMSYQLIAEPSMTSMSRSYAPPPQSMQFQLLQPSEDVPRLPVLPTPYTVTSAIPSSTTTEAPTTTKAPKETKDSDNATFVDVVTVMAKYVRATGTQLSEMFTQLSNSTELNTWGYSWTTPTTTTTTPAPPPPPPPYHAPVVIVMPPAPAPVAAAPQPTYTIPPPPPPMYAPLQPSYQQPQPSFSHIQPTYMQPPPMFTQPLPSYPQYPPSFHYSSPSSRFHHSAATSTPFLGVKDSDFEILDNSIDHDYYYDCDKK